MATYSVNHNYSALRDGVRFGPYEAGTTVELETADAEWVNRDSPGTLSRAKAKAEDKVEQPPVQPNRAHKGGRNRAGA